MTGTHLKQSWSYLIGSNGMKGIHAGATLTVWIGRKNDKRKTKCSLAPGAAKPWHLDNLLKPR